MVGNDYDKNENYKVDDGKDDVEIVDDDDNDVKNWRKKKSVMTI